MHPLLQRQLKRLGLDPANCPTDLAGWHAMLERASQSYVENDQGRALLEQSLDVTSREMQGLYEDLRRSGETELAKERNKLEAVLHSLGDGLCVVDAQWKIVRLNPQAEELFGLPLARLAGQPVYHFLSPGPEEFSHECLITDASIPPLEQGLPFRTNDGILVRGDGQMTPISLVVTPVATDGVVSGAVLVFRDITAQNRAEEQRRESAALLRRVQAGLLELATNADLYRGERSGAFHVITRVASQSLRVARASIWFFTEAHVAIRCADLYEQSTDTHSSGTELPATAFPRYFSALATEDVIVANQAQTDPKTSEFAASYLVPLGITSMLDVPIRAEGKMVGVICHEHIGPARTWTAEEQQFATSVANTVSLVLETVDRRKAEHETERTKDFLNSVVEHLPIMVFVKDAKELRFIRWNKAAEDVTGFTRESVIGKSDFDFFPHDEATYFTQKDREVIESRSLRDIPEEPLATGHRGIRLLHTRKIPILNKNGQPEYLLGISEDITERKQGEAALRTAKEAAESASIAKSQFLANMSHEIRTPMNGVLGLAALLRQTPLSPKQQRLTDTIVRSGNSLLDIINDILDFSKIEAGKLELEHTDFHLRILVDDVLELFAAPAHQKHLELIADVADSVPAFVKGDPARLRQILINLIGNAIKFTSQGEVIVSIVSIAEGGNQSVLCFSVKDSGIGISPDALRSIFQPFTQADGSTTRKYGGTGLGLAIAKQLVTFMGGEIWAESQRGLGATFLFTVHLAHSHLGNTGVLGSKQALPNQRVLVVDDSPTARRSLDRQLRSWGLTSTVAESGTAAVQLLATAVQDGLPFDTVVIDLDMPGMNGLETVHAIHETLRHHHPRVILMTPVERVDAAEDHTGLITATLTKPVRPSDLHRALSGQAVFVSSSSCPHEQEDRTLATPHGSILLAEDNAVNQEVTLGMLEVLGCTATAVENGRRAIDLLANKPFAAILMDCQMPEMDGFEATRAIRRQEENTGVRIPIVALTAHALQGDRDLCLAAGMDDYLSKPFTIEQLRTVLDRWLPFSSQPTQVDLPQTPIAPSPTSALQPDQSPVDPKSWDSITNLQRSGQPDLLAKVISLYLKDSQGLVDKILAAAQGKDFASLRDSAHSLKSRSATLGAWHVADLCKQLESGAREQTLAWTEAERLGKQLQQTFTATCAIFENERQRRAA
jgi:PAS domain S-box-containing protein